MELTENEIVAPLKLSGFVQHYDWGKVGVDSIISKIVGEKRHIPMAELWFGSHPKGSSYVTVGASKYSLREVIAAFPRQVLGARVVDQFGPDLPFLFKVLSIAKPLSIQAHPDKELAKALHKRDPKNYPDRNHKPEIAIAVSDLQILCGFRPVREIQRMLTSVPEFKLLLSDDLVSHLLKWEGGEGDFLKTLYSGVVLAPIASLRASCGALVARLKMVSEPSIEDQWVLKVCADYPEGDIGLFSFYILNLIRLSPGEAIATGPNTAHAYLSGELLECMANSDNVVRAGLTNKFKDAETLISMLEYRSQLPQIRSTSSVDSSSNSKVIREFQARALKKNDKYVNMNSEDSVGLYFNLDGSCSLKYKTEDFELHPGEACLIPASLEEHQVKCSGKVYWISVPK